jgi:hypothetical protein
MAAGLNALPLFYALRSVAVFCVVLDFPSSNFLLWYALLWYALLWYALLWCAYCLCVISPAVFVMCLPAVSCSFCGLGVRCELERCAGYRLLASKNPLTIKT